jgi:CBS domain-containing protein
MREYLNDEQSVADERMTSEDLDTLALQQPIDLSELQPVIGVTPETTISEVVDTMLTKRVGCVVVTEDDQLVGLFTERDLLCKVVPHGIDISSTPVSSVMTKRPETLPSDSPLVYALQRMSVGGYRHVPLMSNEGKAVAVVSMRDIVQHIVSLYPNQILNIPNQPGSWSGRDGG